MWIGSLCDLKERRLPGKPIAQLLLKAMRPSVSILKQASWMTLFFTMFWMIPVVRWSRRGVRYTLDFITRWGEGQIPGVSKTPSGRKRGSASNLRTGDGELVRTILPGNGQFSCQGIYSKSEVETWQRTS